MRKFLIAVAALAAVPLLIAACGDDDDEDPNIGQIGSLSENATYAWAEDGPAGLFDYLAESVTTQCDVDAVASALEDDPIPTGWRQIKNTEIAGDGLTATATVIVITEDGDVEQDWTFAREGESWRITGVPGLEGCG